MQSMEAAQTEPGFPGFPVIKIPGRFKGLSLGSAYPYYNEEAAKRE
jgi:hypothetical protein